MMEVLTPLAIVGAAVYIVRSLKAFMMERWYDYEREANMTRKMISCTIHDSYDRGKAEMAVLDKEKYYYSIHRNRIERLNKRLSVRVAVLFRRMWLRLRRH